MYASKSHVGCCHERRPRYGSVFTKALSSSPSLLLWGSNSRTGNFCLIIPGTDTRRSGPHDVGRIRNHLFPSGQKKKRGLNRGQFPDQQFCGCSYRKRTLKAYILTFPTAIPTDSKRCYLVILLCKSQRQWHQNVVYIMNIYEYILYHLYLSLFFVIRQNGIVYSFISCLCNNKQFGEKAYNFFCTCDNHGFAGYLFHGCLSDGLFFFF